MALRGFVMALFGGDASDEEDEHCRDSGASDSGSDRSLPKATFVPRILLPAAQTPTPADRKPGSFNGASTPASGKRALVEPGAPRSKIARSSTAPEKAHTSLQERWRPKIGEYVDALDNTGQWREAQIVGHNPNNEKILLLFLGAKREEIDRTPEQWVDRASSRIMPFHSKTVAWRSQLKVGDEIEYRWRRPNFWTRCVITAIDPPRVGRLRYLSKQSPELLESPEPVSLADDSGMGPLSDDIRPARELPPLLPAVLPRALPAAPPLLPAVLPRALPVAPPLLPAVLPRAPPVPLHQQPAQSLGDGRLEEEQQQKTQQQRKTKQHQSVDLTVDSDDETDTDEEL